MTADLITDTATRPEIGSRDRQEDRIRAAENDDGSSVIAVADGLGGHPLGDEAAQAAIDTLPERIATVAEMTAALDAANAAAELGRRIRALRSGPGYSQEASALECHINRSYMGHFERGEKNVTLHTLYVPARHLSVDQGELVRGLELSRGASCR